VNPGPTGEAVPLSVFEPNPGLDRETIYNYDIGVEYSVSKELTIKTDLYYSEIKNFIVVPFSSGTGPSTVSFENHPNTAQIYGGNLQFDVKINEYIKGFLNWSFKYFDQKGNRTDSSGEKINFLYAPNHQLSAGTYIGPFYGFSGALELTWQDEYKVPAFWRGIQDLPDKPLNDFTYLNFRLNYSPPFSVLGNNDPLRLSFFLKNILDERPQETLTGVNSRAPGREVFFSAELQFH